MNKKRKQIIAGNEISQIYTFSLGGVAQKVLIEGKTKNLPVVISLHGGPGTPIPLSVGCRGLFPEFTDRMIMVYWDQLGCGINDCKIGDKYDISSYVKMTIDLVKEVKKLFPNNKLILFGVSWGSVLAIKTVNEIPELIDSVVIYGQVIRNLFFNEGVLKVLEKSSIPKKKLVKAKQILNEGPKEDGLPFLTGCIRKYTNGYQNKEGKQAPIGKIIMGLLTSPDYSFKDFKAIVVNGTAKSKLLWPELLAIDLTKELQEVKVPYYIVQGDTDIVTDTQVVEDVVKQSGNEYLHLNVIEKSGHIPGVAGMDAVLERILDICQK